MSDACHGTEQQRQVSWLCARLVAHRQPEPPAAAPPHEPRENPHSPSPAPGRWAAPSAPAGRL